jgi:pyruvate,water dikinase
MIDLAEVGRADVARVGGKAARLGALLHAGFPVPPGFCITPAAYRTFVTDARLAEQIETRLAEADRTSLASLTQAEEAIRGLFVAATMPAELVQPIARAYRALRQPRVAVRSSATAEDLAEASSAGQQASFLNVQGLPDLHRYIQLCWASLWTARALQYRAQFQIDDAAIAIGVVVQTLVPADVAGVLFTANPRSGDRTEIVVNASYGLGEAIVSGEVTPDTYILDAATLTRKHIEVGTKELMVVAAARGTARTGVPHVRRRDLALADDRLDELARLAVRVAAEFDRIPQDIEWAVADGRCWLLQARPITNLPPVPLPNVHWEAPTPGSAWVRRQVAENLPEPLSPLFAELYLREGLEKGLDSMLAFFQMPWFDLDVIADRPLFTTINGYAYQRATFKWSWQTVPLVVRASVASWRVILAEAIPHWRDRALPAYLATIARWQRLDPATASDTLLLAGMRELALADATYWYSCAVVVANAKWTDMLLDRFLALALPGRGLSSGLFLRGFDAKTLDAEAELERLAEQIRSAPTLRARVADMPAEQLPVLLARDPAGGRLLDDLQRYLERYGHQVYTLDFAEPTQADDPRPVLLSLKALALGNGRDVRARQRELVQERDTRLAQTAQALDPVRRWLFLRLLRWAQHFGPYREQALFYMGAGWPTLRRLGHELGQRLVQAGLVAEPDDVFYLETSELAALRATRADLVRLVRERRELRQARRRLHPPAAVPPSSRLKFGPLDLTAFETQRRNVGGTAELRGFAVSPGQVTAAASVIRSPADFDTMVPGTVLVCPTTTPAWTPLFFQASGLVTDVGGILAHGSIVAREYGIPAVMGTGNATERIVHGQTVTVDGDRGLVVLDAAAHARAPHPQHHTRWRGPLVMAAAVALGLLARQQRRRTQA